MPLDDAALREAAEHRGFKLVKSRRRKPGVGDYGFFGLTDATGKALFGIGKDGLTATAQQIADYLRKGEASTWADSAKITPARAKPERLTPGSTPENEPAPSPIRSRPKARQRIIPPQPQTRSEGDRRIRRPVTKAAPDPGTELAIREARPADATVLAVLLTSIGFDGTERHVRRAIIAAAARDEPILIADRANVLGCVSWHVLPTLQHGAVARITAIIVAESARRQGIGRALFDAAVTRFAKRKIDRIEAMSEIAVRNANAFYRALGLEQASYRFVKIIR